MRRKTTSMVNMMTPIRPKWSPQGNTGNQYVLKSTVELILSRLRQKPREAPGEDGRGDHIADHSCPLGESDRTAQPTAPDSCGRHRYPGSDGFGPELGVLAPLLSLSGAERRRWRGRARKVKQFWAFCHGLNWAWLALTGSDSDL